MLPRGVLRRGARRRPGEFGADPHPVHQGQQSCLLACPRGDQNAELLCVNRCKQKLKACKGSKSWVPELPEPMGRIPSHPLTKGLRRGHRGGCGNGGSAGFPANRAHVR